MPYLFFRRTLHFDADQVQIFVIEGLLFVAVLSLLLAPPPPFCDFVFFVLLVNDEAFAFLCAVSRCDQIPHAKTCLSESVLIIIVFLLAGVVDAVGAICLLGPGLASLTGLAIKVLILLLVAAHIGDCVKVLRHGELNKRNACAVGSGEERDWRRAFSGDSRGKEVDRMRRFGERESRAQSR